VLAGMKFKADFIKNEEKLKIMLYRLTLFAMAIKYEQAFLASL
jgi:hypothetical protein